MANDNKTWWMPAVKLFVQLSSYIAGPIILAVIVGNYFDNKLSSKPRYFFISVAVAFVISMFLLFREVIKYQKQIKSKNNNEHASQE